MELELKVSKKKFKNDKNEEIEYISCEVEIGGKTFSLYPSKEQKSLFNYLIQQELDGLGQ